MRLSLTTAAILLATTAVTAAGGSARVYLAEGCSCCHGWIEHMQAAGWSVEARELPYEVLQSVKARAGISEEVASCHTASVGGYIVEGHVPAHLVDRLLAEEPDAIGLSAPGMPLGSPGMGDTVEEPYDVLLVRRDGTTEVFATIRE